MGQLNDLFLASLTSMLTLLAFVGRFCDGQLYFQHTRL